MKYPSNLRLAGANGAWAVLPAAFPPRAAATLAGVGASLAAAGLEWLIASRGGPFAVVQAGLVLAPLVAAVSFFAAARRRALGTSWFWMALAVSMGLGALGAAAVALAAATAGTANVHPPLVHVFYLGSAALALGALVVFPVTSDLAVGRLRRLLDGALVALGVYCAAWALDGPWLHGGSSPVSLALLAYPFACVALATQALYTLAGATRQRAAIALIAAGLLANTAAVVAYAASASADAALPPLAYAARVLGCLLLALGAVRAEDSPSREDRFPRAQFAFPYLVLIGGVTAAYWAFVGGRPAGLLVGTTGLVIVLLLIGRQWLLTAENQQQAAERERYRALVYAERERALRAEKDTEAKSRFLRNMSHELRTPLNAILGFAQLIQLLDKGSLDQKVRRQVEHIESSGRHLLALVEDVLDLSKVAVGAAELHIEAVDCAAVVSYCLAMVRPLAAARQLTLREPAGKLRVRADRRRMEQILLNLLSNAIKFTPPGGTVTVSFARGERTGTIAVTDTGIGIAAADHSRVFEEFVQISDGRHERSEGTGLGLALSQRLAALMGGQIVLESSPGAGSTFRLSLPRGARGLAPQPARP